VLNAFRESPVASVVKARREQIFRMLFCAAAARWFLGSAGLRPVTLLCWRSGVGEDLVMTTPPSMTVALVVATSAQAVDAP
jgi:hypothetical protein